MTSTYYVVKNLGNGKYVSKKNWYSATVGAIPILFASDTEAAEVATRLTKNLTVELESTTARVETYKKALAKAKKELEAATAEVSSVAGLSAKIQKMAKAERDTAQREVDRIAGYVKTDTAQLTKATRSNETSVFVVLEVQIP